MLIHYVLIYIYPSAREGLNIDQIFTTLSQQVFKVYGGQKYDPLKDGGSNSSGGGGGGKTRRLEPTTGTGYVSIGGPSTCC